MYAVEITDTPSGVTEMHSKRFETIWQAKEYLKHGRFVFVEVKSCMADFKSGHGLTFRGDDNWLVCPRDLADELHDKMLLPLGVQVYCPDNGGSLRLRYDLGMRGAGSLREDSTLCLLWAMLMDSYSRWRTTGGLFIEASD